jgi:di/tricarboxylate transporter
MNSRLIGAILFALIGLLVAIAAPIGALDHAGNLVVGTIIITLGLWIFRPGGIPYTTGCTVLLTGCLVAGLKFPVVMSGYASPALWVLIPALYYGYVLQKTGLGRRIVFWVLKGFHPSYLTMVIGWVIVGVLLSLLTPSITVRVAIVIPIALGTVEACHLRFGSREASLISLTAFGMALFPGTGWLTGSLWGPILTGMFPAEVKAMGNPGAWFQGMGLFWLVVTVVYIVLLYVMLRPEKPLELEPHTFKEEYDKLGTITRNEAVSLAILAAAFVGFSTESLHHLPTAATALAAFFLLSVFGVITPADIGIGVNWDIILFLGAAICLPAISAASGIAKWLGTLLDPVLSAWAGSPVAFLLLFVLVYWILRFFDVSWGFATAALLSPIMVPLHAKFGIHPIVVATVFAIGGNAFFLAYQQPFAMMADAISKGTAWDNKYLSLGGIAFAIAAIVALLVSIPYWKAIGFIP